MFSPIHILFVLKNQNVTDFAGLREALHFRLISSMMAIELADTLERLRANGYIECTNPDFAAWGDGSIRLTDKWFEVQKSLNLSLTELNELQRWNSCIVHPIFDPAEDKAGKWPELFVLMPFDPAMAPVYQDHIKDVADKLKLSVGRADDFFSPHAIMRDIWGAINGARVVIADCTGRNANVFYELGVAHTVGKPVVLITQNKDDVPFDIGHIRYIAYQYTPRGMQEFEVALGRTIIEALAMESEV